MKKSAFLLLLLPLLAGCKESTDTPAPVEATKISLLGSIRSTVYSRGEGVIDPAISGFETKILSLNFARINQDASGEYLSYGSTALNATRLAGIGSTDIVFDPGNEQYYTSGETNNSSKLVGWYPRTSVTDGVVNFTIDGSTDVMLSNEVAGSASTPFSAEDKTFTFNHLLTQLQLKVYAIDAAALESWGTIISVKLKGQHTACSVTLPQSISFPTTGEASDLPASGIGFPVTMGVGSSVNAAESGYFMVAPIEGTSSVLLEIETSAGGMKTISIPVPIAGFLAGNAYVITLSFSDLDIAGSASLGTWINHTVDDEVGVL